MPAALHAELAQGGRARGRQPEPVHHPRARGQDRLGHGADDGASRPADAPADGRTRLIAIALVVNAVVIGLAALAAIAVLVLAWRG